MRTPLSDSKKETQNEAQVAQDFKALLSAGGSEDPMVLYKRFRGRAASTRSSLKRADSMAEIRAKKALGQHFLRDLSAAERIADALSLEGYGQGARGRPRYRGPDLYLMPKRLKSMLLSWTARAFPVLRVSFPA